MARTPMILLHGNGSAFNRGCQAILLSTVQMLREARDDAAFINVPAQNVPRTEPHDLPEIVQHMFLHSAGRWTAAWFGRQVGRLLGVRRDLASAYAEALTGADLVLGLGGDNYSLDYGRPVRYFQAAEQALSAGKPFVIWGASVGPFKKDPEYEPVAAEHLKRISCICARESHTVEYLDSLGVRDNVVAVSDPAFLLSPHEAQLPEEVERTLQGPCLGLNLSPLLARYCPPDLDWMEYARRCVAGVLESIDLPVVLVPHVIVAGQDDWAFLDDIRRRVGNDRLCLLPRHLDCRQLKWAISRLTAFAGARTHATIAALSSCVPTLSIAYSVKARGINRDIFGHERFVMPFDEGDTGTLGARAADLLAQADETRTFLNQRMPEYAAKARNGVPAVLNALARTNKDTR